MTEPLEMKPAEMVEVAEKLANAVTGGGLDVFMILASLGLQSNQLDLSGPPTSVWYRVVQAIHAGRSREAGFRSEAVARLITAVATPLGGNRELAELAYQIGKRGAEIPDRPSDPMYHLEGKGVGQLGHKPVFLSYARPDVDDVTRLYERLQQSAPGLPLFMDTQSLEPGTPWLDVIRDQAGAAAGMVCWVTKAYLKSTFCHYEIGLAEATGTKLIFVAFPPSIIDEAPAYLARIHAIRVDSSPDYSGLAAKILDAMV